MFFNIQVLQNKIKFILKMIYDIFCPNRYAVKTCTALNIYNRCEGLEQNHWALVSAEFQKQVLKKSFRDNYGISLPLPCEVHTYSVSPLESRSSFKAGARDKVLNLGLKNTALNLNSRSKTLPKHDHEYSSSVQSLLHQDLGHLLCARWIVDYAVAQLELRDNIRGMINNLLRDVTVVMHKQQNQCVIRGLRVVATGRLGKRKKAMAQQLSRSVGKVPLSHLDAKVDYCSRSITTKLGSVGLKVWVCYN